MKIVKFLTSGMGRGLRIVLGLVIMGIGQLAVGGLPGSLMTLVALIPIAGGLFDFCLLARALGYPLKGAEARRVLAGR